MALQHAPASMPAGWYRDSDPTKLRWWDGEQWTDRVKGAAEPPPLYALSTPAAIGEPLRERNVLSAVALVAAVIAIIACLAVAGVTLTGMTLPPWMLPLVALGGSILALVLGVIAGRRVEYTGEGRRATVIALVLSGVLVLAGLAVAVMQFTLSTI
jgi:prepilin signal peptidase PulO-like enzyme (type II secretory pathway)